MRVCGQWFDTPLRERIMAAVRQEPTLSRRSLAKRVCDWLGWSNPRGEPCLGSARRALAELNRRGALDLPAATPFPAAPRPTPPPATAEPVAAVAGDLATLGPIGSKGEGGPVGLVLHNSHAFTPDGVPLGVVSAECWARDPAAHQTRREPDVRESGKWLAAYQTLADLAPQCPRPPW